MKIIHTVKEVKEIVNEWKKENKTIGFVPTMGYLHNGHKSLIDRAVKENEKTVVSIFVNPIQFGPNEDLESYPRDMERDSKLCEEAGVDLIFAPDKDEMYGESFYSFVGVNTLTEELCGKSRPVHFQGVCTVVTKLFNIVTPDHAYFGQKDAQQLAIIKRMVKDLNMNLEVIGCPIVREEDGLATSSRNTYLNQEERKAALILKNTLDAATKLIKVNVTDTEELLKKLRTHIELEPLAKIDYIEVVDTLTMKPVKEVNEDSMIAMAVYIGKTRLIDNMLISDIEEQ